MRHFINLAETATVITLTLASSYYIQLGTTKVFDLVRERYNS